MYYVICYCFHCACLGSLCGVPNLWGASPLNCSPLRTIWFRSLETQLPSDDAPPPPPFPLPTSPSLSIYGERSAARCWSMRRGRRWTLGQQTWGHTSYCSEKRCFNESGWWWWRTCWSKRRAALKDVQRDVDQRDGQKANASLANVRVCFLLFRKLLFWQKLRTMATRMAVRRAKMLRSVVRWWRTSSLTLSAKVFWATTRSAVRSVPQGEDCQIVCTGANAANKLHAIWPYHQILPYYAVYYHSMCVAMTGSISDHSLCKRRCQPCHSATYYQYRNTTVAV